MTASKSLGHIDIVTAEDLEGLATHEGPCVSVFMPTARAGSEILEQPIRLKNLLRQAATELDAAGLDRAQVDARLDPLRALVDNSTFWQHQSDGLALFASESTVRHFRVPLPFVESVVVGDRFRLLPLWPLASGDDTFYVLALSQNEVRLFSASHQTIDELPLGPIPTSMEEALAYEDPERQLQNRSAGGSNMQFHGHGAGDEIDKATLERYLRAVDKGLNAVLGATRKPVVLACVGYYLPIAQSVTKLANLAGDVVEGNPERRSPDELLAAARDIVAPMQAARRADTVERFTGLAGTGLAVTEVADIASAAREGRVETLLVPAGEQAVVDVASPTVDPLIDIAVADVLSKGGVIESIGDTPAIDSPFAAILRY